MSKPLKASGTGPIDTKINHAMLRIHEGVEEELHGYLWQHFWPVAPSTIQTRVLMRVIGKE